MGYFDEQAYSRQTIGLQVPHRVGIFDVSGKLLIPAVPEPGMMATLTASAVFEGSFLLSHWW